MKSYSHLFEQIINIDNIKLAVKNAAKAGNKKRRRKKQKFLEDIDRTAKQIQEYLLHYENDRHSQIEIYDGISRKKREIIVPTFRELAVQHAIIQVMKPIFLHGAYEHSYAAIPSKGSHLGKKHLEKWIRNDPKHCKYVLKMDIHHFFPSIPHNQLKANLSKIIRDELTLNLLFKIIDVSNKGIPLGFYTSQWLSNWYLKNLDHYIKEKLKAVHYIRYMDDMVVLGSNKRELHKMRVKISEYLAEIGLELKSNWQVYRFDYTRNGRNYGRDIDFMGFRFFRKKTTMRRSIMLKATRTAKRMAKKEKPTIYDIRKMLSYLGWITHTNTYRMYLERIKPFVTFQYFKRRISAFDRRQNKEAENGINLRAA